MSFWPSLSSAEGALGDGRGGDDLAVAVDPGGHLVDLGLVEVGDDHQCSAEVAVEGAVAHRELALVGGVQEQGPVSVGVEHQDGAADAGLEIFLGGVPVKVPLEERLGLLHGGSPPRREARPPS